MKKKLALLILPLLALASCASQRAELSHDNGLDNDPEITQSEQFVPYVSYEKGLPTIHRDSSGHKTYLMVTRHGSIENYGGVDVRNPLKEYAEKKLNYVIVIEAAAGTALPDATQVKTDVDGASFRGWAYYDENNDHVWPDYYDKVPSTNGVILQAIYDGTKTGGGGGGGDTPVTAQYGIKFSNGTKVYGSAAGQDYAGRNQYLIAAQAFKVGDVFSLYDSSTDHTWAINLDTASFGGDLSYLTVDTVGGTYTVNKAFTGNLYIKLSMVVGDQLYIGLA